MSVGWYEALMDAAKKQEEFEEKLKFKNQFKPLDEDDVEYLVGIVSRACPRRILLYCVVLCLGAKGCAGFDLDE